LEVDKK